MIWLYFVLIGAYFLFGFWMIVFIKWANLQEALVPGEDEFLSILLWPIVTMIATGIICKSMFKWSLVSWTVEKLKWLEKRGERKRK